jgi:hypothetical protein
MSRPVPYSVVVIEPLWGTPATRNGTATRRTVSAQSRSPQARSRPVAHQARPTRAISTTAMPSPTTNWAASSMAAPKLPSRARMASPK